MSSQRTGGYAAGSQPPNMGYYSSSSVNTRAQPSGGKASAADAPRTLTGSLSTLKTRTSKPTARNLQYIPFPGADVAKFAVGHVMNRLAHGKTPDPVVLPDQAALATFDRSMRAYKVDRNPTLQNGRTMENYTPDALDVLMHRAVQHLEGEGRPYVDDGADSVLSTLDPKTNKIYVDGFHGKAGSSDLFIRTSTEGEPFFNPATSSSTAVSSAQVAQHFAQKGLPQDFRDLRLLACEGADSQEIENFGAATLAAAEQPAANGEVPAGAHITKEMNGLGFGAVNVRAYHGSQLFNPREFPSADGRSVEIHAANGTDESTIARRSAVKANFSRDHLAVKSLD